MSDCVIKMIKDYFIIINKMINWIYEWLYSSVAYAPARNAPNEGVDIKKFIESKPDDVVMISAEEINHVKQKLNKIPEVQKTSFTGTPLIEEFNTVFSMGYKNYFEQKKLRKID